MTVSLTSSRRSTSIDSSVSDSPVYQSLWSGLTLASFWVQLERRKRVLVFINIANVVLVVFVTNICILYQRTLVAVIPVQCLLLVTTTPNSCTSCAIYKQNCWFNDLCCQFLSLVLTDFSCCQIHYLYIACDNNTFERVVICNGDNLFFNWWSSFILMNYIFH